MKESLFFKIGILVFLITGCSNQSNLKTSLNDNKSKINQNVINNEDYIFKFKNKNIIIDKSKENCAKLEYIVKPSNAEILWTSTDENIAVKDNEVCYNLFSLEEKSIVTELYGSITYKNNNETVRLHDNLIINVLFNKKDSDDQTQVDPNTGNNIPPKPGTGNDSQINPDINTENQPNLQDSILNEIPTETNLLDYIKALDSDDIYRDTPKPYVDFNYKKESFFIIPSDVNTTDIILDENYFKRNLFLYNSKTKLKENAEWFVVVRYPEDNVFNENNSNIDSNSYIQINKLEDNSISITSKISKHFDKCIQNCTDQNLDNDKYVNIYGYIVGIVDNKYLHKLKFRIFNKGNVEKLIRNTKANNAVKHAMTNIIPLSDVEKVFFANQYVVDHITYDDTYLTKNNDFYTFVEGKAVCDGYANMFYRLSNELGIDTKKHIGNAPSGYHSWNSVILDDGYYFVDPTWADNVGAGGSLSFFMIPKNIFLLSHQQNERLKGFEGTRYHFYGHKKFGLYADNRNDFNSVLDNIAKYSLPKKSLEFIAPNEINIDEINNELQKRNIVPYKYSKYYYKNYKSRYDTNFSFINNTNKNKFYYGKIRTVLYDNLIEKVNIIFTGREKEVNLNSNNISIKEYPDKKFICTEKKEEDELNCEIKFIERKNDTGNKKDNDEVIDTSKLPPRLTLLFIKEGYHTNKNDYVIEEGGTNSLGNVFLAMPSEIEKGNEFVLKKNIEKVNLDCSIEEKNINFIGTDVKSGILKVNEKNVEFNIGDGKWIPVDKNGVVIDKLYKKSLGYYDGTEDYPYTIILRKKNDLDKVCSHHLNVEIHERRAVPSWIVPDNSGFVANVTTKMEYKLLSENSWISVGDSLNFDSNSGKIKMAPGEYIFRFKSDNKILPSYGYKITVK